MGDIIPPNLSELAKTDGNPLRKFCCRQCGECAPKELLEEGRFLDRISWLRNHYASAHPGMWGKVSAATTPKGIPRRLSLEQVSGLETRFPIEKLWADERAYLDKLTAEIEREGLTEPITIRVRDDGSLIVWDGMHRLAVAQKLGIKDIPVEFIGNISAFSKRYLGDQY